MGGLWNDGGGKMNYGMFCCYCSVESDVWSQQFFCFFRLTESPSSPFLRFPAGGVTPPTFNHTDAGDENWQVNHLRVM